ncbi:hypothetical protein [Alkalihalobacterium alkalinitrilicum]|uniref:hypothetical protein n=1 Tax=Alkalihalobacterium alkalinitrilicum TaxID=427920 RepID=UPI000995AAA4|nr:hypothetical protein [Alkalihalobacterium alkalinitrilicum]
MDVIPFENTWPYEKIMNDIYLSECPYCEAENVLIHLKARDLQRAKESIKTIVVMPCCNHKMTILEADDDYFWTDEKLRK